jgi:hypothetical protein
MRGDENILLVGDFSAQKLDEIGKQSKPNLVKVVEGSTLASVGDAVLLLTNMGSNEMLVINGIHNLDNAIIDLFASKLLGRDLFLETGNPPQSVTFELENFILVFTVPPNTSVDETLFTKLDLKMFLGRDAFISLGGPDQSDHHDGEEDGYERDDADLNEDDKAKDAAIAAVSTDGFQLENYPEFQDDKEVVIAAINESGAAIQFASSRLRCDKEVVLLAVKNDPNILDFVDKKFRDDDDVMDACEGA